MIKRTFFWIFIFLFALEILFRLTGVYAVYSERIGMGYSSYWGYSHDMHYKVLPRNQEMHYEQPEFSIKFRSNRYGMRNPEFQPEKPDSLYRIICLGDSFTEGDGAPWGFSYPRQLENLLNQRAIDGRRFEVINAGKNGSDIIYAEKILTDLLYRFQPNLVLIAVNDSDIDDIIQRGGSERFHDGGITVYRAGPWWEFIYAKSRVFRFAAHVVFRKNNLLLGPSAAKREAQNAAEIISASMQSTTAFCREQGITVRFVYHPLPWHIKTARKRCAEQPVSDSLWCFRQLSGLPEPEGETAGLTYNLFPGLTAELSDRDYSRYAWPLNGHYNIPGYRAMAGSVYRMIEADALSGNTSPGIRTGETDAEMPVFDNR